jgi:hypothetical protein
MSKPILIIKTPRGLSRHNLEEIGESLKKQEKIQADYHILLVPSETLDDFHFQGLFPKDFDSTSFEELKQQLKEEIIII